MADEQKTGDAAAGTGDAGAAEAGKADAGKTGESGAGKTGDAGDAKAGDAGKTGDGGTAGTSADGKAGKDGASKDAAKAPETYALKVPAGAEPYLDAVALKQFEAQAKKRGLTNEQAQTVLEDHADQIAEQSTAFRTETEADPIYGGEHLVETQRLALQALDKVRPAGTPRGDALRALLNRTGYGNHLEVVALLADLGKMMAEDSPARAGSSTGDGAGGDPLKKIYDHPTSR
jgi:hypothetical protein